MKFFNDNFKWITIAVIAILILLSLKQCSNNNDLYREKAKLEQKQAILNSNIEVLKDTIKYWKDADGNSKSSIKVLSADKDMLKAQYADLNKKYLDVVGKGAKDQDMIAYLNTQIRIKDRTIADLKGAASTSGSRIINDSTILVDIKKVYDSLNYYQVNGNVYTHIVDDKIKAGKIDLTTQVGLGIDFAISRDKKTKIATITSKTAFPAQVKMGGITQIEQELNKKPQGYLGLSVFAGYGMTLQKQPMLSPMIGVGIYYSPRWLTIKIRNR